jgi:hypothetical protein
MKKTSTVYKVLAIVMAVGIVGYVFFANTIPFSVSRTLALTPNDRLEIKDGVSKQTDNLVYFNSKMPFKFNQATAKIIFKNSSADQQILLGYRDQSQWHYNTQTLDYPVLDNLTWQKIGNEPYLYQKESHYKSIIEFFSHPPQNKVLGVADYKDSDYLQSIKTLPNYMPANTSTSINAPLRGKTTMYVYLNNEPFKMSFTKRDLNWYADPDTANIAVYKGLDRVYSATIDDDGNASNNQQAGQPETIDIKNPGPSLPEPGVYKIVIDSTGDSLITNITTNLHKIAFEGPLYVADNHEVYSRVVPKTMPTNLITNAQHLSFRSDHGQSKTALVDKQVVNVNKPNQVYAATSTTPSTNISIPSSDMIINGSGYFAFSKDQFFTPSPYKVLPINSAEDIDQADYILTNYQVPKREGDWLVAERDFNISGSVLQKGQLSWLINSPNLKENNRSVEYKQIEMTLSKKGWFKQ